jgi:alanyl aminopeptidase
MGELLAVLPPFAQSKDRQVIEATIGLVEKMREFVPATEMPRYAALVQRLFGPRAHQLGWMPGADDDDDARLLRPKIVGLVAYQGDDRALQAEAAKLVDTWLADPRSVDGEVAAAALVVAARSGGPELFDRLLPASKAIADRRNRRRLQLALGSFEGAPLIDRALGLILSPGFDIREAQTLLEGINSEPAGQERTLAWLQQSFDALAKALPRQMLGRTPLLADAFCDDAHGAEVETFFKGRNIDQYDGGTRTLAQTLERIHLCSAYRVAQAPSIQKYLAAN